MQRHRNKLVVFLVFLIALSSLFFIGTRKNPSPKTSSTRSERLSDNKNQFVKHVLGEWHCPDLNQVITFRQKKEFIVLEVVNKKKSDENKLVEITVSEQLASGKHWILDPIDEDYRYHINQVSEDEIILHTSTTRPNVAGTSKPFHYYRVE